MSVGHASIDIEKALVLLLVSKVHTPRGLQNDPLGADKAFSHLCLLIFA